MPSSSSHQGSSKSNQSEEQSTQSNKHSDERNDKEKGKGNPRKRKEEAEEELGKRGKELEEKEKELNEKKREATGEDERGEGEKEAKRQEELLTDPNKKGSQKSNPNSRSSSDSEEAEEEKDEPAEIRSQEAKDDLDAEHEGSEREDNSQSPSSGKATQPRDSKEKKKEDSIKSEDEGEETEEENEAATLNKRTSRNDSDQDSRKSSSDKQAKQTGKRINFQDKVENFGRSSNNSKSDWSKSNSKFRSNTKTKRNSEVKEEDEKENLDSDSAIDSEEEPSEDETDENHKEHETIPKPLRPVWKLWAKCRSKEEDEPSEGELDLYRRTPVVSGALAPFSIMLEIPGLTSKWYVRTLNKVPIDYQPNPTILDVGLSISLAGAVLGNVFILLRFLEIMKPRKSTFLAIICFFLHDVINIVALITFGVIHRVDDGFTLSEAYWMTVAATIASVFTTISLIYDFFSTKHFKHAGSGLSPKQKELVILVMSFLLYLSLGSLVFSSILDLNFQNGLYFTIVSVSTVGLGDIDPAGVAAKVFMLFFAPVGIVIIALLIGAARGTILEEFQQNYSKKTIEFKQKYLDHNGAQKEQKKLRRKLRRLAKEGSGFLDHLLTPPTPELKVKTWKESVAEIWKSLSTWHLTERFKNLKSQGKDSDAENGRGEKVSLSKTSSPISVEKATSPNSSRFSNEASSISEDKQKDKADSHQAQDGTPRSSTSRKPERNRQSTSSDQNRESESLKNGKVEDERSEKDSKDEGDESGKEEDGAKGSNSNQNRNGGDEFDEEVKKMESALQDQKKALEKDWKDYQNSVKASERVTFWIKFSVSWTLFVIFWLVGTAVFMSTEGWTFFDSLFFCFVVFTTIGYGTRAPVSPQGRAFFTVWALFGIAVLSILFGVMGDNFGENFKSALNRASTERASKGAARIRNLNKKKKRKKGRDGSDISESSRGEEEKRQSGDGDEEEEGKVENKNGTRSETDTRKLDQDLDLEKGDSKNEEKEQDPQKESSSQRSSSSSKRSKKYSPADIPVENLPIQLARSASMFHHYASQYMETHQEALVELVSQVPKTKEILPPRFGGQASPLDSRTRPVDQLSEKERKQVEKRKAKREEIRDAIKGQDEKIVAISDQIFSFIDFEEQYHNLLTYASATREEILSHKDEPDDDDDNQG